MRSPAVRLLGRVALWLAPARKIIIRSTVASIGLLFVEFVAVKTGVISPHGQVMGFVWISAFAAVEFVAAAVIIVMFGEFANEIDWRDIVNFENDIALGYGAGLLAAGVPLGFYFLYLAWRSLMQ